MAKFTISMPDGSEYDIEGPDEWTDADAFGALQQYIGQKPAEPELSGPEGLLRQFAHGASFGFDDELAGLASKVTGGDYESARESYLQGREQYAEDNPVSSFTANVAGGLATGIGGGAKLAASKVGAPVLHAVQQLPRWAQLGSIGGAAGAVQGAGDADEGNRLAGATGGGVAGFMAGALVPPIVGAVTKGVKATVGPVARAAVNAFRSPAEKGVRLLDRFAAMDSMTADDIANNLKKLGPNATIADAGGENVKALAEAAVQRPGEARNAAVQFLDDRAKGAQQRIVSNLAKGLKTGNFDFDSITQGLHENMRKLGQFYEPVLNSGAAPMNDDLARLMQSPTMKSGLNAAMRSVDDDIALGKASEKMREYFSVDTAGNAVGIKEPTLRVWDYVKRGLDDVIRDGTDPLTGKMSSQAASASTLKTQLLKQIDKINPEYAAIRSAYADEKSAEHALTLGRKFLSEDSEVTVRRLADMSKAEKEYFRMGAARAIRDKVMNAEDTHTAFRKLKNNPAIQEKVKPLFGGSKSFNNFMDAIERESTFSKTRQQLTGNSATARRIATNQEMGMPIAGGGFLPTKEGIMRALALKIMTPGEPVMQQVSNALISSDPLKQQATLNALRTLDSRLQKPFLSPNLPAYMMLSTGQQLGPD